HRLLERLALHPLGDQRRRRNGGAAAVSLELGVLDEAVLAHTDLQLHHVAARRSADHARAYVVGVLGERSDVARIFVMIQYLVAVCHFRYSLWALQCAAHCTVLMSTPSLYISHSGDSSRSLAIFWAS